MPLRAPRHIQTLCLPTRRIGAYCRNVTPTQLSEDFNLLVQTAAIACNYFDRYIPMVLSDSDLGKDAMQVIASTCLLIAAKFFDRKLPPLSELVLVHSHAVTAADFAMRETDILVALGWQLHVILPHAFIQPLKECLLAAPFDSMVEERMQFFIDLSVYGMPCRCSRIPHIVASIPTPWQFSLLALGTPRCVHSLQGARIHAGRGECWVAACGVGILEQEGRCAKAPTSARRRMRFQHRAAERLR